MVTWDDVKEGFWKGVFGLGFVAIVASNVHGCYERYVFGEPEVTNYDGVSNFKTVRRSGECQLYESRVLDKHNFHIDMQQLRSMSIGEIEEISDVIDSSKNCYEPAESDSHFLSHL